MPITQSRMIQLIDASEAMFNKLEATKSQVQSIQSKQLSNAIGELQSKITYGADDPIGKFVITVTELFDEVVEQVTTHIPFDALKIILKERAHFDAMSKQNEYARNYQTRKRNRNADRVENYSTPPCSTPPPTPQQPQQLKIKITDHQFVVDSDGDCAMCGRPMLEHAS